MTYMNESDSALFKEIYRELKKHNSWDLAYGLDRNVSAGALVTDLMLAVHGEEIVYVTATVDRENGLTSAAIVTSSTLILGEVESVAGSEPRVSVSVESLNRIRSIRPHGTLNALVHGEWRVDWPERVTLTIALEGDREVTVPYEHVGDDAAAVRELYAVLRGRLTGGPAPKVGEDGHGAVDHPGAAG